MELETNIRLIRHGVNLRIKVREALVEGTDLSPDIIQRACRTLQFRRGIAAIPHPTQQNRLLVAAAYPIKDVNLKESNWAVYVRDSGKPALDYCWSNSHQRSVVTQLVERALHAHLAMNTDYWTLDSPHIWYESKPFKRANGIVAYRRYTVGAIDIDDIGVGIITEISTAFFTEQSLNYFFSEEVNQEEQHKRQARFQSLTSRQKGKKGTLLYAIEDHRGKCYFADAPARKTCATTGEIRIDSKDYPSLVEYYKDKFPEYDCNPKSRAIRVNFTGYKRPSWVDGRCLFVRVMNDSLPRSFRKISSDRIFGVDLPVLFGRLWAIDHLARWQEVSKRVFGIQVLTVSCNLTYLNYYIPMGSGFQHLRSAI